MNRQSFILAASSLLTVVAATACSSQGEPKHAATRLATPAFRVVQGARAQIAADTIVGILGSYQYCADPATPTGTQWVLDAPGHPGAMEGIYKTLTAPSVWADDSYCTLEIDAIQTDTASYSSTGSPTQLDFTGQYLSSVAANQFLPNPVQFVDVNATFVFYANAMSTNIDASGNWGLTLLISDDPGTTSGGTVATVATVTGGIGSVNDVPPPNYAVDLSGLTVLMDPVSSIVTGVSGNITLDFGGVAGVAYGTYPKQDWSSYTFAQLDSNFNLGAALGISGNSNVSIPASALVNVGDVLPQTGSVVVWSSDVSGSTDVITYEVIAITFNQGPVAMVTGRNGPIQPYLFGGTLYWSESNSGEILSCVLGNCGTPPQIHASGQDFPSGLASDGTNLYWGGNDVAGTDVFGVPITGGTPTDLTSGVPVMIPSGVAVDSSNVYFGDNPTDGGVSSIVSCPTSGCGAGGTLATTIGTNLSNPDAMTVVGSTLYFTTYFGGVYSCPTSGCGAGPTLVQASSNGVYGVAVSGTSIYWSEQTTGTVNRCPLTGCGASSPTVLATGVPAVEGLALDSTYLYFAVANVDGGAFTGGIYRVPQ